MFHWNVLGSSHTEPQEVFGCLGQLIETVRICCILRQDFAKCLYGWILSINNIEGTPSLQIPTEHQTFPVDIQGALSFLRPIQRNLEI